MSSVFVTTPIVSLKSYTFGILRVMCTAVKNSEKLASKTWNAW